MLGCRGNLGNEVELSLFSQKKNFIVKLELQ